MLCIVGGCKSKFNEKKYLTKILNNLEQVKSASYTLSIVFSEPGDTVPSPYRTPFMQHYYEFANPADTMTGAIFALFSPIDTMLRYYDGNLSVLIDHARQTISIDTLSSHRTSLVFFSSVKNIINYALTTNDSLLKEFHDFGD